MLAASLMREDLTAGASVVDIPTSSTRVIRSGELIFQAGQGRGEIFEVEKGAVCSFRQFEDGRREIVEFAVSGDAVGLGYLPYHLWSAETVTDTVLRSHSPHVIDNPALLDDQTRERLARAMKREFDILRDEAIESGRGKPLARIASYLLAISSINEQEGRSGAVIGDDFECGFVAECLGLDINALARHLIELSRRGLIEFCPPHGLRLVDLDALENLGETG